jgi:5-methylcytosine-specific restriction endonuclease McrA
MSSRASANVPRHPSGKVQVQWKREREKYGDKRRADHRAWMKANPESNRANVKQWRKKYPAKRNAQTAKHYAANSGRIKARDRAYGKAHPEIGRASANRRRVRLRGCGGEHTVELINDLFRLQKGKCSNCKTVLAKYEVDHVMPLIRGGSDDISNLQLLCVRCNRSKGTRDPYEWAQRSGRLF